MFVFSFFKKNEKKIFFWKKPPVLGCNRYKMRPMSPYRTGGSSTWRPMTYLTNCILERSFAIFLEIYSAVIILPKFIILPAMWMFCVTTRVQKQWTIYHLARHRTSPIKARVLAQTIIKKFCQAKRRNSENNLFLKNEIVSKRGFQI